MAGSSAPSQNDSGGSDWSRKKSLIVIGLIASVIGIVSWVTGKDSLQELLGGGDERTEQSGSNPASGVSVPTCQPPGNPESVRPVPVAPAVATLPYAVDPPARRPAAGGDEPEASLDFDRITNRGKPVSVPMIGSGFTPNSLVSFQWYYPDGTQGDSTSASTDERGVFSAHYLWWPMAYLGVDGNDGTWTAKVEDTATDRVAQLRLDVTSDGQTPTPDQWLPKNVTLCPLGPPKVSASTSGVLCSADGALSSVRLSGFTPEAPITVRYVRPDGRQVMERGEIADGSGEVSYEQAYWKVDACDTAKEFAYQVVATESDTGRRNEATMLLHTKAS